MELVTEGILAGGAVLMFIGIMIKSIFHRLAPNAPGVLECPECGHTPNEAGLRPRGRWVPFESRRAACWHAADASGWGDTYCGCAHAFHAS